MKSKKFILQDTQCIMTKKLVGVSLSYNLVDYTNKYDGLMQFNKNKDKYIHQWYSFVEGYSKDFIVSVLNELDFTPNMCLEPFAGSGTTPLELQKKKISCISFEVNPFMHKLARVKMNTKYTVNSLSNNIVTLEELVNDKTLLIDAEIPGYKSIVKNDSLNKWFFNKDIFQMIQRIKTALISIKDKKYRELFEVTLASLFLKYSNVYRNGKCLSYKKNWKDNIFDTEKFKEEFFYKLKNITMNDIKKLNSYSKSELFTNRSNCIFGDMRKRISFVEDNSIDLIITSPPYLNSRDYTDIYMIELWMLDLIKDYNSLKQLRKNTLRSHVQVSYDDLIPLNIELLIDTLKELEKHRSKFWNKNLLNMVIGYFDDMNILFSNLKNKLTNRGRIYFNVANSAYHGVLIEVDKIIAEIAKMNGFKVEEIRIARNLKTSAQQKELIGSLRESVIVIKK